MKNKIFTMLAAIVMLGICGGYIACAINGGWLVLDLIGAGASLGLAIIMFLEYERSRRNDK